MNVKRELENKNSGVWSPDVVCPHLFPGECCHQNALEIITWIPVCVALTCEELKSVSTSTLAHSRTHIVEDCAIGVFEATTLKTQITRVSHLTGHRKSDFTKRCRIPNKTFGVLLRGDFYVKVCWALWVDIETGLVLCLKASSRLDLLTQAINIKTVFTIEFSFLNNLLNKGCIGSRCPLNTVVGVMLLCQIQTGHQVQLKIYIRRHSLVFCRYFSDNTWEHLRSNPPEGQGAYNLYL